MLYQKIAQSYSKSFWLYILIIYSISFYCKSKPSLITKNRPILFSKIPQNIASLVFYIISLPYSLYSFYILSSLFYFWESSFFIVDCYLMWISMKHNLNKCLLWLVSPCPPPSFQSPHAPFLIPDSQCPPPTSEQVALWRYLFPIFPL